MQIQTLPDITGTGAAVRLSQTPQSCKWFQVNALSIGGEPARLGDKNVTADRGIPLTSQASQFSPPIAEANAIYDLYNHWIFLAEDDVVAVSYAV